MSHDFVRGQSVAELGLVIYVLHVHGTRLFINLKKRHPSLALSGVILDVLSILLAEAAVFGCRLASIWIFVAKLNTIF